MDARQPSITDLVIETHIGLERQGPGSPEMTAKAFAFVDNHDKELKVADLGCGSGAQAMILSQQMQGEIICVDLIPGFIDVLNDNVRKRNLQNRIKGIVGSMDDLPFPKEEFDMIWSEGAIDTIGLENGLSYWSRFLKRDGYVAVSCPSWFTHEHPAEVARFWSEAGSNINTIEYNVAAMQSAGYQFVASFTLPETCWEDYYFAPRKAALESLAERYPQSTLVTDFIAENQYEEDLYSKYKQQYGYAFYIGKKV